MQHRCVARHRARDLETFVEGCSGGGDAGLAAVKAGEIAHDRGRRTLLRPAHECGPRQEERERRHRLKESGRKSLAAERESA